MLQNDNFRISEIFRSIQGEGPSTGQPCLFVRLATCNLTCQWCDTAYSWDFERYDFAKEVLLVPLNDLARRVTASGERRLVITGGEPLIQQRLLGRLVSELPRQLTIEIETNGTIRPEPGLLERVDQWNVSPKLANSGEPEARRLRRGALEALLNTGRAWLKIVVRDDADAAEAAQLAAGIGWPKQRVLLMPLARTTAELDERSPTVARACVELGFGFSPRLHLSLFGGERGH